MASEKRAKDLCSQPAWIDAVVSRHNHAWIGDIFFSKDSTLEAAAIEAYRIAGITKPLEELDVIELYDPASYTQVSWLEYLQLCEMGKGRYLVEEGVTAMGGRLPVNPSGGVVSTNPIGATALIRVAEAALQIQGRADKRQVDGVRRALATGFGGSYWNEVFVLSAK